MARLITRPPTAKCTLPMYIGFLISEPKFVSCQRVSEVLNISHDSVNRFLQRESYTPLDLYNEVKHLDDEIIDKNKVVLRQYEEKKKSIDEEIKKLKKQKGL